MEVGSRRDIWMHDALVWRGRRCHFSSGLVAIGNGVITMFEAEAKRAYEEVTEYILHKAARVTWL